MPSGFHDILFPVDIGINAQGGVSVDGVSVYRLFSGVEQRNIANEIQPVEWRISRPALTSTQLDAAVTFMRTRNGQAYTFRFLDYSDYQTTQSIIGTATDGQTDFQLKKVYSDDGGSFTRVITKPIDPNTYSGFTTPIIYIDDTEESSANYSINYATGVVTFTGGLSPNQVVKATFDFHAHVRFDMNKMNIGFYQPDFYRWNEIVLMEEKEESNV